MEGLLPTALPFKYIASLRKSVVRDFTHYSNAVIFIAEKCYLHEVQKHLQTINVIEDI